MARVMVISDSMSGTAQQNLTDMLAESVGNAMEREHTRSAPLILLRSKPAVGDRPTDAQRQAVSSGTEEGAVIPAPAPAPSMSQ